MELSYNFYIFFIQNNSAHLFRNLTEVIGAFVGYIKGNMILLTEIIVLIGVFVLLLLIKPLLTLSTIICLGVSGFVFYKNIQKSGPKTHILIKSNMKKNINYQLKITKIFGEKREKELTG